MNIPHYSDREQLGVGSGPRCEPESLFDLGRIPSTETFTSRNNRGGQHTRDGPLSEETDGGSPLGVLSSVTQDPGGVHDDGEGWVRAVGCVLRRCLH